MYALARQSISCIVFRSKIQCVDSPLGQWGQTCKSKSHVLTDDVSPLGHEPIVGLSLLVIKWTFLIASSGVFTGSDLMTLQTEGHFVKTFAAFFFIFFNIVK